MADMFHKHGGDIYSYNQIQDFSANINFRGMPGQVKAAALDGVERSVHYPDPEYRKLKKALACREEMLISRRSGNRQPTVSPEQIICGNGAAELMFALAAAVKPQKALLAVPSFFEYEQALSSVDCGILYHLLKEEQEFQLDAAFLAAITEDTDMVILGNPNNPTGRLIPADILRMILEECRKKQAVLVLDESFFDFLPEADRLQTFSGVEVSGRYPNLFVLKSFTKMYGMPGLRFGYGISGDRQILGQMKQVLQPWNVSVPAAEAAAAAAGELAFADETASVTEGNRVWMQEGLERAGYRVYPSHANFLLFQGPVNLQERCLQQGILIRDCSNFPGLEDRIGTLDGKAQRYFRICIRSMEENQRLLAVLENESEMEGAGRWQK